jgi:ribonuclease VapC
VIVVDTSALVAITEREPEWLDFLRVLERAEAAFISPMNYVEAGIVLIMRRRISDAGALDRWLAALQIRVRDDLSLGSTALQAYLAFGKGVHPARLNLADAFAYALAKQLDVPLLYKGDDFALTDVRSALQPT